MAGENYTNTASVATTAAPIGPSDTSVTLANFSGYPAAPFWGELEKGTSAAELVRVTNVAGSTLTITRGEGGLSATSHGAGVNFELVAPADFYTRTEAHMAATNAHGVTGSVVGTSGNQTLQDKTYRGAHRSLHSDTLPAGVTASYESVADNTSARDGFVHKNTAGDAARSGFLLQQSGVDRFKVSNTGNVTIAPSTGDALTVTGNETVSGTLGVTGAATLSGGVTTTTVNASGTVTSGTINSSGSLNGLAVSVLGTVHANGTIDTDSNLVVDGTSTLTGAVTAGAGIAATQGVTAWGGRHVIPSVNSTADVTAPVGGMVVYDQSVFAFKYRVGSTWTLEPGPLGLLARAERTTDGPSGVTTITGCLRLDSVSLKSGRRYRIYTDPMQMLVTGSTDTVTLTQILYSSAGTATTASTQVPGASWETHLRPTTGSQNQHIYLSGQLTPGADGTYSFLLAYSRLSGTGTANLQGSTTDPITIYVEDLGSSPSDSGVDL